MGRSGKGGLTCFTLNYEKERVILRFSVMCYYKGDFFMIGTHELSVLL